MSLRSFLATVCGGLVGGSITPLGWLLLLWIFQDPHFNSIAPFLVKMFVVWIAVASSLTYFCWRYTAPKQNIVSAT